jgi:hypothetical protein
MNKSFTRRLYSLETCALKISRCGPHMMGAHECHVDVIIEKAR